MNYSEHTGRSVGYGCNYVTLARYNNGARAGPPIPAGNVSGYYVVPRWSAPGYATLTHNQKYPSCSGFFNIQSAYGRGAGACNTSFSQRLCG